MNTMSKSVEAFLQVVKKNVCQPIGVVYFAIIYFVLKFFSLLKKITFTKEDQIDLRSIPERKIRIDVAYTKTDPFYVKAILHYLFVLGKGSYQVGNTTKTKKWNIIGKHEDYQIPEDGILFFSPDENTNNKIYVHINNINDYKHSLEIEFFFNEQNMWIYQNVKEVILNNYQVLFDGINSQLIKKFILNQNEWVIDIGINPIFDKEIPSLNQVDFQDPMHILLTGSDKKIRSMYCLEIAKKLNFDLYVLPLNIPRYLLRNAFDKIPSKSVIELTDIEIENGKLKADYYDVRHFIDKNTDDFLTIFSVDQSQESALSYVPGLKQRIRKYMI